MKSLIRSLARSALVAGVALALAACSSAPKGAQAPSLDPNSLLGVLAARPDVATMMGALKTAGLDNLLVGRSPMTILAPSEAAFQQLGRPALDNLLKPENRAQLTDLLKNHLVSGSIRSGDISGMTNGLPSLYGKALSVGKDASGLTIGGARVTTSDILANNGIIHVIDRVLVP